MLRRCLAASILTLLTVSVSSATQTADLPRIERVETWLTAVQRHVPGAVDSPLILVAASSTEDRQELWHSVHALLKLAKSPGITGRLRVTITTAGRPRQLVYNAAEVNALRVLIAGVERRGGQKGS